MRSQNQYTKMYSACTMRSTNTIQCTVLYSIVRFCTILYKNVQYCTVLYRTVQYCTYNIVQYCTVYVQYCTALYILHIIHTVHVQYCTVHIILRLACHMQLLSNAYLLTLTLITFLLQSLIQTTLAQSGQLITFKNPINTKFVKIASTSSPQGSWTICLKTIIYETRGVPVGLEQRWIPDQAIQATDWFSSNPPSSARLYNEQPWMPVTSANAKLVINLGSPYQVLYLLN